MTEKRKRASRRGSDVLSYEGGRFQAIFQHSAVSLWEEDISALQTVIESLRARGIIDMRRYTEEHLEFLREAARLITVIDVNEATLTQYEVADRR